MLNLSYSNILIGPPKDTRQSCADHDVFIMKFNHIPRDTRQIARVIEALTPDTAYQAATLGYMLGVIHGKRQERRRFRNKMATIRKKDRR